MKTIGEVAYCDIIPDAENKSLSSGSALVEYVSAKLAARAIRELNRTEIDGWEIFVREDRVGMPCAAEAALERPQAAVAQCAIVACPHEPCARQGARTDPRRQSWQRRLRW